MRQAAAGIVTKHGNRSQSFHLAYARGNPQLFSAGRSPTTRNPKPENLLSWAMLGGWENPNPKPLNIPELYALHPEPTNSSTTAGSVSIEGVVIERSLSWGHGEAGFQGFWVVFSGSWGSRVFGFGISVFLLGILGLGYKAPAPVHLSELFRCILNLQAVSSVTCLGTEPVTVTQAHTYTDSRNSHNRRCCVCSVSGSLQAGPSTRSTCTDLHLSALNHVAILQYIAPSY